MNRYRTGIAPPFNTLDPVNGIPLGSAVITDLSSLSLLVQNLVQGIAYYFRVAAINLVGQGPFAFAPSAFVIPEPQVPGMPVNSTLSVIDSSSMEVSFYPPVYDGGEDVSYYKIEYGNAPFVADVQQVSVPVSYTHLTLPTNREV